jgi:hypothetical protein
MKNLLNNLLKKMNTKVVLAVAAILVVIPAVYVFSSQSGVVSSYGYVNFNTFKQYKANFHVHTQCSDGSYYQVGRYSDAGYSILALTDHDAIDDTYPWYDAKPTWPWTDYSRMLWSGVEWSPNYLPTTVKTYTAYYPTLGLSSTGMLAVCGNELSGGHHTVSLFSDAGYGPPPNHNPGVDTYFNDIAADGGVGFFAHPFVWYNHPASWYNAYFDNHRSSAIGMEIHNGCFQTNYDGLVLWDSVNKARIYNDLVWGFSEDDAHSTTIGYCYTTHYMKQLTESALRENLVSGAFTASVNYVASTVGLAPVLTKVAISGNTIIISGTNMDSVLWYDNNTNMIHNGASIDTSQFSSNFVRAELLNSEGVTYTQPFGLKPPE